MQGWTQVETIDYNNPNDLGRVILEATVFARIDACEMMAKASNPDTGLIPDLFIKGAKLHYDMERVAKLYTAKA